MINIVTKECDVELAKIYIYLKENTTTFVKKDCVFKDQT